MTWSLVVYLLPFALLFGLGAWLRFIATRRTADREQQSPATATLGAAPTERDAAAPAPERSRRAALLPVALVIGLAILARKLIGF
jgi:hypothetical protein